MTRTIKIALYFSLAAFAVMITWAYFHYNDTTPKVEESITLECFQTEIGWGYRIVINNKTFIYQPFIPVIAGHKGFPTKETAEKIGQMVVEKLKNKEKPVITVTDLKNSGISTGN